MALSMKRSISHLLQGNLVLLKNQQGEGKLLGIGDKIDSENINFMIKYAKGLVSVGLEESRAKELKLQLQRPLSYTDYETPAYTVSVDIEETTTGISAFERYLTIKALTDGSRKPEEFKKPGHIFPVVAHCDSLFGRQSHVELGLELVKATKSFPSVVLCEVLNEEGGLSNEKELELFSKKYSVPIIEANDVIAEFVRKEKVVTEKIKKEVTNGFGRFTFRSFGNKLDSKEDFVFVPKKAGLNNQVIVVKKCIDCHTMTCNCYQEFQQALSYIHDYGGVCLQINSRDQLESFVENISDVIMESLLRELDLEHVNVISIKELPIKDLHDLGMGAKGDLYEEAAI